MAPLINTTFSDDMMVLGEKREVEQLMGNVVALLYCGCELKLLSSRPNFLGRATLTVFDTCHSVFFSLKKKQLIFSVCATLL